MRTYSLAMRGEVLPAFTLWAGNPAVPVGHTGMAVMFKQVGAGASVPRSSECSVGADAAEIDKA
jgi:hypothetical protein